MAVYWNTFPALYVVQLRSSIADVRCLTSETDSDFRSVPQCAKKLAICSSALFVW